MSNDNCSFLNMCSCPLRLERPCGLPCPELHQQGCTSRAAPAGQLQQRLTGHDCPMAGHISSCSMLCEASAQPLCKHDMHEQPAATTSYPQAFDSSSFLAAGWRRRRPCMRGMCWLRCTALLWTR